MVGGDVAFHARIRAVADGNDDAADQALTRMRALIESIGVSEAPLDRSEPFHIESLLVLGEVERARAVLERLEQRGRAFPRLWISTTLPRARALLLAAEGDTAGALAEIEKLDLEAAARIPFELGATLLVTGRLHRRVNHKRAAAESLQQALELFERLGAPAWAERARAELGRVGLRHRPPNELTATELRVAELAATGLTNREVATAAFMSPKTVEANLSRSTATRHQLPRRARRKVRWPRVATNVGDRPIPSSPRGSSFDGCQITTPQGAATSSSPTGRG